MAQRQRLLVIGAVAAGMSTAAKARRTNPSLEVVVFEQGDWISYSACGLPYFVGGLVEQHQQLLARSVAEFAQQGIEVRVRHTVTAIDPARRVVRVIDRDAGSAEHDEPYDLLVIATGSRPQRPAIEGIDLKGVFTLYTMDDALGIRAFIEQQKPRSAVVVGGGYIGMEALENLVHQGIATSVVQRGSQVFPRTDPPIADLVLDELKRHNVNLSLRDTVISACQGEDGRVTCVETSQGQFDTDMVVVAIGVRPNVSLAEAAGITIGATGAVAVDDHQRTNLPGIYAAGDCAEHRHLITGKPAWVPLGTTANKQGRIAGANAAGGDLAFDGIVGTTITRVFDMEIGRTGLTIEDARQAGIDFVSTVVDYTDIAGYYPGHKPLRLLMVAERRTGRLLGLQAAGSGVDKRIDVAATALHAGMTVDTIAWLDLGYAPPFNSVWDPFHVAASNLQRTIEG